MHTQNRGNRDDRSFANRNQNQMGRHSQFQGNQNQRMGQGGQYQGSSSRPQGRMMSGQLPDREYSSVRDDDDFDRGYNVNQDRGGYNLNPDRGGFGWQRGSYGHESERFHTGREPSGQQMDVWDRNRQGHFGLSSNPQEYPFLGKGPKGYARSDDRIREEICERLSEGYLDASEIEVLVRDGEVILTGTVFDRQTKRLAEEIADGARGVRDIENRLKVKSVGQGKTDKIEIHQPDQKQDAQPGNYNPGTRDPNTSSSKRSFV